MTPLLDKNKSRLRSSAILSSKYDPTTTNELKVDLDRHAFKYNVADLQCIPGRGGTGEQCLLGGTS